MSQSLPPSLSENILPWISVPKSCNFWTTWAQQQSQSYCKLGFFTGGAWYYGYKWPKTTAQASPPTSLNESAKVGKSHVQSTFLPFTDLINFIWKNISFLCTASHPHPHLQDCFPLSAYISPPSSFLPKKKISSMEPMPSWQKWFFHPYLGKYPFGLVYSSSGRSQEGNRRQSNLSDWFFCVPLWLQAPGVQ